MMLRFDTGFLEDPYPTYTWLRTNDPIHEIRSLSGRMLLLTRASDVHPILKSDAFQEYDLPAIIELKQAAASGSDTNLVKLGRRLRDWLFFMSGEDHQQLRRILVSLYSARRVDAIRHVLSDRIAAALASGGVVDVIGTIANTLPAIAAMTLLGIPLERHDEISAPAAVVLKVFEPFQRFGAYGEIAVGFNDLGDILGQLEADDALEALIHAIRRGMGDAQLSGASVRSIAVMLFAAGQDTISGAISNSVALLADRPDILAALRQAPDMVMAAARELVRYDPPVQIVARVARENLVVAGRTVEAGDRVSLVLGSACRDPDEFDDPDRADIGRRRGTSTAFGLGRHFCVGSQLALIAVEELLRQSAQFESIRICEARRRHSLVFRGHLAMTAYFEGKG
jgi:pimeloyl-[acyl-carrier protein] synthase